MGFFGRLTGWEQQGDAHNAVVASHFVASATLETKRRLAERIVEIQRDIKGRYAGSLDDILRDLNEQPRAVQMNFVALACNTLGLQPSIRGVQFNEVRNPYFAKGEDTLERIDGVVRFINTRFSADVSWPGNAHRVNFAEWLSPELSTVTIKCPSCTQAVRIPRGKNLRIKCPACAVSWVQRT